MAGVRQTRTGKWELSIRSSKLPKAVYFTYDTEAEARAHGQQLDRLLAAGTIPVELLADDKPKPKERLGALIRAWLNTGQPAKTDQPVLLLLFDEVGKLPLDQLTYTWSESWVREMKLVHNWAPGTIRKRIGSLSRALDWWLRSHPDVQISNPLRLLPRGAAAYNAKDAADIAALNQTAEGDDQRSVRQDMQRDRRLLPGEFDRILAALAGDKRPDRERPMKLEHGTALRMLFLLIYHTGVRLREAYTLRRGQVDLAGKTLNVQSGKQWHGRIKMRKVPMGRKLHALLTDYLVQLPDDASALVFPWWSGEPDDQELNRVTSRLSGQFGRLFDYAGCKGLTEHDLRHEATCRWYEMRDAAGGWLFRDAEIDRIMGWEPGSKMSRRYASFRAEDLAARMW